MQDSEKNDDKRPVGRPLKIQSVEELAQKIEEYFGNCDPHIIKIKVRKERIDGTAYWAEDETISEQRPYTMSGLAHALGISRQTLLDYGERGEFLDTIEDAKERVHRFAEEQLFGKASSGAAFSLKNNWGWKERQEVDHSGKVEGLFGSSALQVEVINAQDPTQS
jgi:DNA-binding XRE family transcriptional regulator